MVKKRVQMGPAEEGNTTSSAESNSGAKYWCFTHNFAENMSFEKDIEDIKRWFDKKLSEKLLLICKKYFISLEEGSEKKRLHLQGYIHLNSKKKLSTVKKIITKETHWEKCKGDFVDNITYIFKEPLYQWNYNGVKTKKEIIPIKTLKEEQLYSFQKDLEQLCLNDVCGNKIIWICDLQGQIGKTEWLRYMHVKYGCPFAYGGKCSDIINLAYNNKDYLLTNEKPIFIYNLGRDTDPEKVSYASMEQLSDGAISNTKFEGACFVFNKPHVIVLANCWPNTKKLTASRWIFKCIYKGELLSKEDYLSRHVWEDSDSSDSD